MRTRGFRGQIVIELVQTLFFFLFSQTHHHRDGYFESSKTYKEEHFVLFPNDSDT